MTVAPHTLYLPIALFGVKNEKCNRGDGIDYDSKMVCLMVCHG
jgi:hypothetical protein